MKGGAFRATAAKQPFHATRYSAFACPTAALTAGLAVGQVAFRVMEGSLPRLSCTLTVEMAKFAEVGLYKDTLPLTA